MYAPTKSLPPPILMWFLLVPPHRKIVLLSMRQTVEPLILMAVASRPAKLHRSTVKYEAASTSMAAVNDTLRYVLPVASQSTIRIPLMPPPPVLARLVSPDT